MNISETFIRRPIATSLVMAGIALFGVIAYRTLPVSDLPTVANATVNVSANLAGGDPGTMAASVASPLERQFTTIAGIDEMTSSSVTGNSTISLTFDLNRDIDSAAVDVQTAIAAAMPLLPSTLTAPPSFRKANLADEPIFDVNITSDTIEMSKLDDYAENILAPRISMVSGVSQVNIQGAAKYAVRVQVDPEKLRALQIGINDVHTALQNWNVTQPMGQLFGQQATFNLRANGQLNNATEFSSMVVAFRNGRAVRLSEVAKVVDSVQTITQRAWFMSKAFQRRSITLEVLKQPGTNVIQVADAVQALLPDLEAQLPPSVHLVIKDDNSIGIRHAFGDMRITMVITLALVVGVIYLFLHNVSATLIPALALPFSILGAFVVMSLLHYSLNNLSMMALVLSVGFIVDDAIVMLENVVRHMEAGEGRLEAALTGAREIGFTIVTMTVSLAAAFIPILFMAGILGRLFREFAVTIVSTVFISGVVSLTLTPMLCSRFLRIVHTKRGLAGRMDRIFDWLRVGYGRTLRFALTYRPVMLVVLVGVLYATVKMFGLVPKGFIPDTDNDSLRVQLRAEQGTSYYDMVSFTQQIAEILKQNTNIDSFMANTGGGAASQNTARFALQLIPRARRSLTAQQIAQQLRGPLGRFPAFRAFVTVPASLRIGAFRGNSSYNLTVQSLNTDQLYEWAPRLERAIAALPGLQDVSDDMELRSPRVNLTIDRDKAAAVGLSASPIAQSLADGFGPEWVSTIYGAQAQYQVLLELDPRYQQRPESLNRLSFRSQGGQIIPLESVVSYREAVGPQSVNHYGQLPAVNISFGLPPGVSLGTAIDRITNVARQLLPPTVTTSFQGSAKVFQDSLTNFSLLFFVAVAVVYIVLGILYESYIHPITILSGLPPAAFGGLVTLWAFGNELNIYSFVGLILLIGLVMKNGIMQIDFALEAERQEDKTPTDAIYEGCLIRFRPILMTSVATMLGALPIALGFGTAGEARRPLGLAVIGGLFASQLVTLYLTPVIYTYLAVLVRTRKVASS
jgi:HAE1 family hydrophobic/amphiphilic exporter-1